MILSTAPSDSPGVSLEVQELPNADTHQVRVEEEQEYQSLSTDVVAVVQEPEEVDQEESLELLTVDTSAITQPTAVPAAINDLPSPKVTNATPVPAPNVTRSLLKKRHDSNNSLRVVASPTPSQASSQGSTKSLVEKPKIVQSAPKIISVIPEKVRTRPSILRRKRHPLDSETPAEVIKRRKL